MTKYEVTEGCIAYSSTIDGVEMSEMSRDDIISHIVKLLGHSEKSLLHRFLIDIVEENTNSVMKCSDDSCECCGDTITTWTLEID